MFFQDVNHLAIGIGLQPHLDGVLFLPIQFWEEPQCGLTGEYASLGRLWPLQKFTNFEGWWCLLELEGALMGGWTCLFRKALNHYKEPLTLRTNDACFNFKCYQKKLSRSNGINLLRRGETSQHSRKENHHYLLYRHDSTHVSYLELYTQ